MRFEQVGPSATLVRQISKLRLLATSSLLLGCLGCWDYTIPLGGGYELVRLGSDMFVLVDPAQERSTIQAGPSVVLYRDFEAFVVGKVGPPILDPEDEQGFGYFLCDKRTHTTISRLSRAEWEERLALVGFDEAPRLHRPNRFQAWF